MLLILHIINATLSNRNRYLLNRNTSVQISEGVLYSFLKFTHVGNPMGILWEWELKSHSHGDRENYTVQWRSRYVPYIDFMGLGSGIVVEL